MEHSFYIIMVMEGEAGFDPLFYAEKQRNERPELIVFRPWYQVFDNGREVPVFSV